MFRENISSITFVIHDKNLVYDDTKIESVNIDRFDKSLVVITYTLAANGKVRHFGRETFEIDARNLHLDAFEVLHREHTIYIAVPKIVHKMMKAKRDCSFLCF